tara:strand:+ start:91356 stop:91502 length:147 start_codon:yes stop_codon:yes gene_type:complete
MELETQLEIALRLNYIQQEELDVTIQVANEVGKMLSGLSKVLKSKSRK